MSDNAVEVQIRANVAGLTSGLKEAAGAVATSSQQMSADLRGLGESAKATHPQMFSLGDSLKHYRSEMRQEARLSRFLAADIASMGIASKGAAGEVTHLVAAFALGGALGGAIAGVKLVIEKFMELHHEQEKASELAKLYGADLKTMGEDGAKHVYTLRKSVTDTLLSMRELRSETMLRHELEEPLKREKELKEQIAKIQKEIADASTVSVVTELGVLTQDVTLSESRKAKLEKELNEKKAEIAGLKKDVAPLHAIDLREVAVAESIEEAKRAADQQTVDNSINLAALKANEEMRLARETATFKEALEREIANAKRRADDASEESARNLLRIETEQDEKLLAQKKTLKDQKEGWQAVHAVASVLASDITSMLFDAKSLDDVLKDIARQVVQTAIQFALKAATMSIFGFEHGGDVPSAAGGWDVPSVSGAIPAVLHPREMVLPESYADVIRGMAGGDGGGGVTINVNGAIDGNHVMRTVTSPDFAKAVREARRLGRW